MGSEPWLEDLSDDWKSHSSSVHLSQPQSAAPSSPVPPSHVSRIPRYVSPRKNAPAKRERKASNRLEPLRESSAATINSKSHASEGAVDAEVASTGTSKPTTLSSVESVIRRHEASTSPRRHMAASNNVQHTPDWKMLALRKQDMFSPMGLENIFQRVPADGKLSTETQSFSFNNDLSHMPSSPPPWISLIDNSSVNPSSPARHPLAGKLATLAEETLEEVPECGQSQQPIPNCICETESSLLEYTTKKTFGEPRSSSSVTDGFSPVFISKHNTVDGRIDYVAFDPSTLPKLSEHVNVERGGHSEDGSFKRRPLSSTQTSSAVASDSVAPSDSVSQVQDQGPHVQAQDTNSGHEDEVRQPGQSSLTLTNNDTEASQSTTVHHIPTNTDYYPSQGSSMHTFSAQTVIEKRPSSTPESLQANKKSSQSPPTSPEDSEPVKQILCTRRETPGGGIVANEIPTLYNGDVSRSNSDDQLRRPQSVAGKKRKDARYDSSEHGANESIIAQRDILRPRNPTPWHGLRNHRASSTLDILSSPITHGDREANNIHRSNSLVEDARISIKARSLALEAATFTQRKDDGRALGTRQKSVSTQDYLNEAMRIMDLIRARKQATTSDWSSNTGQESELPDATEFNPDQSAQSITRPPSRDGPPRGWRTQVSHAVDPRIESQLRKYEETGDESFLVSSIVRSVRMTEEAGYEHEQDGIRIIDNPQRAALRRNSDPGNHKTESDLNISANTRASDGRTDRSENTQKTSSTQKLSSITRIAPEHVSHLIHDEEAGMRFDSQRQTWVKCKNQRLNSSTSNIPASSATTDDDPLGRIPDLSVHEPSQAQSIFPRHSSLGCPGDPSAQNNPLSAEVGLKQKEHGHPEQVVSRNSPVLGNQGRLQSDQTEEDGISDHAHTETPPLNSQEYAYNNPLRENVLKEVPVHSIETQGHSETNEDVIAPLAATKEKPKRREQSVLFSSPPVSRAWDAKHWTDSSDLNDAATEELNSTLNLDNSQLLKWQRNGDKASSPHRIGRHHWSRSVSMSHTDQRQEISFIEQRPDGRTYSLNMSVSTPLPTRRRLSTRMDASSGLRHCSFMDSLSPLSEFSISNDDQRHVQHHALARPVEVIQHGGRAATRSALTTNELVDKLTTAEPDEPYWDFMHRLSLAGQGLGTVNMLDEFCPRLEELDISDNSLEHLNGAPGSLRCLNMANNRLSSLTGLSHLQNLQYINISGNGLTSLTGFSSLVHLRELSVERNKVTDIDGILDLDGLLSINLAQNDLETLDFSSAQLTRLHKLDLSANKLTSLGGLSKLSALEEIDLSSNLLSSWHDHTESSNLLSSWHDHTESSNARLRCLHISSNGLRHFDAALCPSLEILCADENSLTSISNATAHDHLSILSLRDQLLAHDEVFASLDELHNVTELFLSGTALPALLPLTQPCLNLRKCDLSFTGLQALPSDFGTLVPSLQTLNLNANSIKDLRPLEGIIGLKRLHVAHNRLKRLRSFVKVLSRLGELLKGGSALQEVDARGNPLTVSFYASGDGSLRVSKGTCKADPAKHSDRGLRYIMGAQERKTDETHASRLDEETRLRRRIYELLLGSKCPKLEQLDGLHFFKEQTQRRDAVWEQLVEMGVVQKVD